MLRVQLLGGITLLDSRGEPITAATAQRRPAALLAVLAMAGEQGLTRDKIVGLLWPESDSPRARHSLTQALYAMRRATGADDLFHAGTHIHLNRERIEIDVDELDRALREGDADRVADLYAGPFLDGFFLSGAAEFDHWVSGHRAHLESRVIRALDANAETAEQAGEYRHAIRWRERQAGIRPLDSTIALKLITARARLGDRGGAIRQAQIHAALLRSELDLPLTDEIVRFMNELRRATPVTRETSYEPVDQTSLRAPMPAVEVATSVPHVGVEAARGLRARISPAWIAGIPAAIAAGIVVVALHARTNALPSPVPVVEPRIAVAPFHVTGAPPSLTYMGEAMADLLTTRVRDDAGAAPGGEIQRLVSGTVVGTPARVIVSATMVDVPSGATLGSATAEGPADSVRGIADRLAARLLTSAAKENPALADLGARSLPALRAYLLGNSAVARGDYRAAMSGYERALRQDSTFAPAALNLALTASRMIDGERTDAALVRAWAHRDNLDARDRARLTALAGPDYPSPPSVADQRAAWQQAVRIAPGSAEAWSELAGHLLQDGHRLGTLDGPAQATAAVQRALALNPDYQPAKDLLAQIDTANPSSAVGAAPPQLSAARTVPVRFDAYRVWRRAVREHDAVALLALRRRFAEFDRASLRAIAMSSAYDAAGIEDGLRAASILSGRATTQDDRVEAALIKHSLYMNAGRIAEALVTTMQLHELRPESHAYLRLRVLDAIYGDGDQATAARSVQDLAAASPALADFPLAARQRAADLCVVGQWRLAHDDTTGVRTIIALLKDRSRQTGSRPSVSTSPSVCAELLIASHAVVTGSRRAPALVRRVDSMLFSPAVAGYAAHYSNIAIARMFATLGDPGRALAAIRKHGYLSGWPSYLSTTWREERRLAALAGDVRGQKVATERYGALRRR